MPQLGAESKDVTEAASLVPDARARHYWDGGEVLGKAYRRLLGLDRVAWDIYFIYGPKARWTGADPPKPDFWMHQLRGVTLGPRLDAKVFAAEAIKRAH